MEIEKDAVLLLTSPEPDRKKVFGTGFAVAHNEGKLFILTCAHVVEQLDGKVIANGQEAAIVAIGSSNAVDLALLSISCNKACPLLNRAVQGSTGMRFQLCGYSPFAGAKENYVLRAIQGRLGKPVTFESVDRGRVEAWDIHVEDDEFSKLQGGYSGSPLCNKNGGLIAVVSHNADPAAGQRGHAVAISNLKTIYPEIEQLIPSFARLDAAARIQQAMSRLPGRAFEILEVIQVIGQELKRMKQEGIKTEDDKELIETIEQFLDETIDVEAFILFARKLHCKEKNTDARPNYEKLAEQLNGGQVVLCLGQELSHLLGTQVPSTAEIIQRLAAREGFQGPLSEICEQKEIAPDSSRAELVNELRALFWLEQKTPPVALYELLARLEHPFLVISTGYDDLLEQCLQGRRKLVVIYPNIEEKKCLLRYSDQQEVSCIPEELSQYKPLENGYTIIYRLRGGIISNAVHLYPVHGEAVSRLPREQAEEFPLFPLVPGPSP